MILIVFGAPGSGKGTQSERLARHFGLHHISTGDLLRAHIKNGTLLGRTAHGFISAGHLIPDQLMLKILAEELRTPAAAGGVILDGFPRTIPQAEELDTLLAREHKRIDAVVGLEVPDDELEKRLIERGKSSGRSDDNPEAIAERLRVYHSQTKPLISYYQKQGHYIPVNGTGPIEDIFADICLNVKEHCK